MDRKNRQEFDLFKIAGVQIAIDYSWLVIFVLVLWSLSAGYFPEVHPGYPTSEYWIVGIVGTFLFFASIVIHELSHAIVGNSLGQPVKRISLFIFGGMAHLGHEPTDANAELKIAAAGPLTSFVLGVFFFWIPTLLGFRHGHPMWASVFDYLGFINIALGLFNLLPGFPLDGGRILRAAIWARTGDFRRATARAADWGRGIAWGLIALGALEIFAGALVGGLWLIFIALFLKGAASSSYQGIIMEQVLGGARVRDLMVRDPEVIDAGTTVAAAVNEHFAHHGYTGFPVVEDGRPVGMLAIAQIRDCPAAERAAKRVAEVMKPINQALEIGPDATLAQALRQMSEAETGRLLVIENGRLIGLITRSAIAHFIMVRNELGFSTDERPEDRPAASPDSERPTDKPQASSSAAN
jgi:Zn-dependent protease/CBS domain-containing protein